MRDPLATRDAREVLTETDDDAQPCRRCGGTGGETVVCKACGGTGVGREEE